MAKLETLSDTFDTQNSTLWGGWGATVVAASGGCRITPAASTFTDLITQVAYDATSSVVIAELAQMPADAAFNMAYLDVRNSVDPTDGEGFSIEDSTLFFRERVNNVANSTSITFDPVAHRWLRLKESAGQVLWDTSPDGLTWVNRRTITKSASVDLTSVDLCLGAYSLSATAGTVVWGSVNPVTAPSIAARRNVTTLYRKDGAALTEVAAYLLREDDLVPLSSDPRVSVPPPIPTNPNPEPPPVNYAITGTAYYVAANGSDTNNGTSTSTPWQTVDRAMTQTYTAGDGLLFRRGDTFYVNRIDKNPNANGSQRWIIGAYGTGARPILSHYKILNNPGSWTLHSTGVWKINLSSSSTHTGFTGPYTGNAPSSWTNIGFLMINGVAYGWRRTSTAGLVNQWDFAGWPDTTYLYVKSSANPTSLAGDIRAAPDGRMIITRSNMEVVDLELVGSGGHGLSGPGGGVNNVVISRNWIHHIGGSILIGYGDNTHRYGNGQEFWAGTTNATVTQNTIEDVFDTGVTVQGGDANTSNITWDDNDISRCCLNFELFKEGGSGATWTNIKFEHNRVSDGGNCWAGPTQPNQDRRNNVTIGPPWTPSVSNVLIRYNTFTRAASWHYFLWNNGSPGIPAGVTFANNTIALVSGTKMQWPRSETIDTAAAWRTATGLEQGSTFTVL